MVTQLGFRPEMADTVTFPSSRKPTNNARFNILTTADRFTRSNRLSQTAVAKPLRFGNRHEDDEEGLEGFSLQGFGPGGSIIAIGPEEFRVLMTQGPAALMALLSGASSRTTNRNPNVLYSTHPRFESDVDPAVEEWVELFTNAIPPAGKVLPLNPAPDPRAESFNRDDRMRVFYHMAALIDLRSQANDDPHYREPSEQIFRLYELLKGIENIATRNLAHVGPSPDPDSVMFHEDFMEMEVRYYAGRMFEARNGQVSGHGERVGRHSHLDKLFSTRQSVLVIPSTCEYTIIDGEGRVLVFRVRDAQQMQRDRWAPYGELDSDDINEAIQKGELIFSINRDGTDALGRPASENIHIADRWRLTPKQRATVSAEYLRPVNQQLS